VLEILERLDDAHSRANQVLEDVFLRLAAQRYPIDALVDLEQVSVYSDIDGATQARITHHVKPEIVIEQPEVSLLVIDCVPWRPDGGLGRHVIRFREPVLGRGYWSRDTELPLRARLMKVIGEMQATEAEPPGPATPCVWAREASVWRSSVSCGARLGELPQKESEVSELELHAVPGQPSNAVKEVITKEQIGEPTFTELDFIADLLYQNHARTVLRYPTGVRWWCHRPDGDSGREHWREVARRAFEQWAQSEQELSQKYPCPQATGGPSDAPGL